MASAAESKMPVNLGDGDVQAAVVALVALVLVAVLGTRMATPVAVVVVNLVQLSGTSIRVSPCQSHGPFL